MSAPPHSRSAVGRSVGRSVVVYFKLLPNGIIGKMRMRPLLLWVSIAFQSESSSTVGSQSLRRVPTATSAYLYCDVLVLLSKNDFVALFASSSLNGDFYVANFYIVVVVDYSALSFVVSSKEHIHACTLRLQSTYFTSSTSFRIT